ncbi:MAG: hypothetical protein JW994_00520 [Candidatus Omnitrophica bacterium]|nr:hypothetical protein [Candidatus Omnitrophota bacterium]
MDVAKFSTRFNADRGHFLGFRFLRVPYRASHVKVISVTLNRRRPHIYSQIRYIPIALVILYIFSATNLSADTIELKSGRIITCDILRENADAIIVSTEKGKMIYSIPKDKIENIEKSTAEGGEENKKETFAAKIKKFWRKATSLSLDMTGSLKKEKISKEKQKEYLLEKYEEEVQSATKARKDKMTKKSSSSKSSFRDFISDRCIRKPCGN